ncbi:MAG: sugar phosphate isomerase/epimerase [Planctomycetes bacterium]|nr:sugar phosphate isomerase/epimerase [Planctomycetota bacterium]
MNESLSNYARLGIIHFMLWPQTMGGDGPIAETIERLAADADFEAIELTRINDPATRRRVRELAETARVTLAFGAQPILLGGKLDLNAPTDAARTAAIEAVQRAIDQALELRAVGLAVLSGPDPGETGRKAATDRLVDSLKWLCDYAAHKGGPTIVLETFDRVAFGKNCLIGPNPEAAEVARRVRRDFPSFGLMIDLSHLPLQGETPQQAVAATREFLVHAHMGNCVMRDPAHEAYGDSHPRFGVPGGENDVAELAAYLRALLDAGFLSRDRRPVLSFEVKPLKGESVEALIAGSKRTLAAAWAAV